MYGLLPMLVARHLWAVWVPATKGRLAQKSWGVWPRRVARPITSTAAKTACRVCQRAHQVGAWLGQKSLAHIEPLCIRVMGEGAVKRT